MAAIEFENGSSLVYAYDVIGDGRTGIFGELQLDGPDDEDLVWGDLVQVLALDKNGDILDTRYANSNHKLQASGGRSGFAVGFEIPREDIGEVRVVSCDGDGPSLPGTFEVEDVVLSEASVGLSAQGRIRNTSNRTLESAHVSIDLYRADGLYLGGGIDLIFTSIAAGQAAPFDVSLGLTYVARQALEDDGLASITVETFASEDSSLFINCGGDQYPVELIDPTD